MQVQQIGEQPAAVGARGQGGDEGAGGHELEEALDGVRDEAPVLERVPGGREPGDVLEVGVGGDAGDERDPVREARLLRGEQAERRADGDADQADLLSGGIDDGERGRERPLGDLALGEPGRVRHEHEEAGAGERACEPLDVGVMAAAGGDAVQEDERRPAAAAARPVHRRRDARDELVLYVRRVGDLPRRPREHGHLARQREHAERASLCVDPGAVHDAEDQSSQEQHKQSGTEPP